MTSLSTTRCAVRKLLVTGGAGFIGSNFVHYWLDEHPGERVVVLDLLSYAGNPCNLQSLQGRPEFRFVQGDIRDGALVESLLRAENIDTLVHFAAESHVNRSITGPDAFIETNVVGTHSLLKAARKVWLDGEGVPAHRFHHVSTDEVYGSLGPHDPAFTESTAYAPNSPYSASKAASDHLVRAYHHTFGLQVTTSNCSNNYGPRHFPEKLIPLCIVNILRGLPLPIYGDGKNVRDWLHVSDHCRGIDLCLTRGVAGEVYNIGGGSEAENLTLVMMLCDLVDEAFAAAPAHARSYPDAPPVHGRPARSLITFVKDRAGHDRRYAIDSGKARRMLGYEARHALGQGLRETLEWYLSNEEWWRSVLSGAYQKQSLKSA
jgi:dTDP-glucose 4,6-dehydratase